MFEAGIPLTEALHLIGDSAESSLVEDSCRSVAGELTRGESLPAAAGKHPQLFNATSIRLLQVGVKTGALVRVLRELATLEERGHRLTHQLRASLGYPILVVSLCLLAAMLLPPLIFGGVLEGLGLQGRPVPSLTRGLMMVSDLLRSPWFFLGMTVLFLGLSRVLFHSESREYLSRRAVLFFMAIPPCRRILTTAATVRFAHVLGVCQSAGLSLYESLPLAAQATGNPVVIDGVMESRKRILDGAEVVEGLASSGVFDRLFLSTVEVGVESGSLPKALARLAGLLEMQLEQTVRSLLALLEPFMFAVVGLLTGLSVIAMMLPMVALLESL